MLPLCSLLPPLPLCSLPPLCLLPLLLLLVRQRLQLLLRQRLQLLVPAVAQELAEGRKHMKAWLHAHQTLRLSPPAGNGNGGQTTEQQPCDGMLFDAHGARPNHRLDWKTAMHTKAPQHRHALHMANRHFVWSVGT